ncbi:MAG TPA: hypothetical protein VGR32_03905 [Brevundimonas sp.]|jgi:hypothetical protein|uniref:hypothetical protein n=1 Tax=Brevundimonas sp. TaxID=1871086 RepID=UPI002DF0571C|nr:hypothetical protein [Brevundimonas sp.]
MSIPMRANLEQGIGLEISCWCGHRAEMPAADALARFDPDMTYAQVANRFTCTACHAHGHPRIQVRMSIADFYRDCRVKGLGVGR